jgi:hypothetical protein
VDGYVDALAAFCTLINGSAITGTGKPLSNGVVYQQRPRSPGSAAVGFVTWIATPWETSEGDLSSAVLSTSVFGTTEDNARKAAVALANLLRGWDGEPQLVPAETVALLCVEQVTGPSLLPGNEYAYLVDATCNFEPM